MTDFYGPRAAPAAANATTAGVQTLPRSARLGNNSYVLVWEDRSASADDPTAAIRGQRFDASGNKVGGEFLVNTVTAGAQSDPSVAATGGGGFVVAWTGTDSSGTGIKAQLYTAAGAKSGAEFQVNTTVSDHQSEARAVDVPGVGFVVVWLDHSGTGSAIRGQFYYAGGTKWGSEFVVASRATEALGGITVAPLADNSQIVVSWTEANGDLDGSAAMTKVVTASGTGVAQSRVSEATIGNQLDSAVAAHAPSKGYIVAYVDAAGPGTSGAIKVRMFGPDGAARGPDLRITAEGDSGTDPSVITFASGLFAVSWRDSAGVVRVQMVNGSGEKLGDALAASNGPGELATLMPLGTESFVAAWADGDIQTRIFDPVAPAVADIVISDTSFSEGVPEFLPIAALGATGIGGSSGFSYSILSDSTGGAFAIVGDRLVVRDSTLIDFESASQAQVAIRARDLQGRFRDETFTLTVGDAAVEPERWSAGPLIPANDAEWGPGRPDITALAGGGFVMVYNDSRYSGPGSPFSPLRGQVFSASGARMSPEFEIDVHQDGNAHVAAVAGLADGGFVAIFIDAGQARGQIFDVDGQAVGEPFVIGTNEPGGHSNLEVAALPSGGFVVTWNKGWSGSIPTVSDVRAQIFDSTGDKLGAEIVVPDAHRWMQTDPAVGVLEDGGFVIAWKDDDGAAIFAQRFDAGGGRVGDSFRVSPSLEDYKVEASVTGLAGGGFVVTWQEGIGYGGSDPNPWDVKARIFDASGAPVGDAFLAHNDALGAQRSGIVIPLKEGGFVITWNEHASPDGQNSVQGATKAQMFNAVGARVGGEFAISTEFAEEHLYTAAAALPWGGIVVGYGDYSGNTPGFTSTVKARIIGPVGFDARADAVVTDEATILVGNVFADNGSGADVAPAAGTPMVEWVNGSPAAVGKTMTLGSGALLTLEADGTFSYDPNHRFDSLALWGSGGSNQQATDSFSYKLAGGDFATVTVTVRGLYSTPHEVIAGPNGNWMSGSNLADIFVGGNGNDTYVVDAADSITDFGMGIDTVRTALSDYTLPTGVESLVGTLEGAGAGQALHGNGRNNLIVGSQANDLLSGHFGDDMLVGGGGLDNFVGGSGDDLMIGGTLSATNLIVNGGFETQDGTNSSREYILAAPTVDPGLLSRTTGSLWGWQSPTGAVRIETVGTGDSIPFNAGDGAVIVNLITPGSGYQTIHQDIGGLTAGTPLLLTFATGWPPIGYSSAPIEVLWNGVVVGSFGSGETAMKEYGLLVTAADGTNRLAFRPSDAFPDRDAVVIDKVELRIVTPSTAPSWARYDAGLDGGSGRVLVNLSGDDALLDGILIPAGHGRDTNGNLDAYVGIANVRTTDASGNRVLGSDGANHIWGGSGADIVDGGGGDDVLTGNGGDDQLDGGSGDDLLDGGDGVDMVRGGPGDDVYLVDAGDIIFEASDAGTDEVRTALASFSLQFRQFENLTALSDSAHEFRGNAGSNILTGGGGNDFLLLQDGGDDRAVGGGGNDVLYFGAALSAGDVADGGPGRDAIVLQGNVTVVLTDTNLVGIESISLQSGANSFFGDTANNFYDFNVTTADSNVAAGQQLIVNGQSLRAGEDFTFDGSAENDGSFVVYGGHGVDNLTGGDGVDVFFFEGQRWGLGDKVDGGAGRDSLAISAGSGLTRIEFAADALTNIESISVNNFFATDPTQKPSYELVLHNGNVAPGGTLIVNGSSLALGQVVIVDGRGVHDGNLRLFGGGGHDTLTGGDGADFLIGGGGADSLTGGAGADTFRYDAVSDSAPGLSDLIGDFVSGSDKFDLSRVDANGNAGGDQAFTWIGGNAFTGVAGQLRTYEEGGYRWIAGDTDGDGDGDLVIALQLGFAPPVQGDFLL